MKTRPVGEFTDPQFTNGRIPKISAYLRLAEKNGRIRTWYCYALGDWRGRRWVLDTGSQERVYSTSEVEAYLDGLDEGHTR